MSNKIGLASYHSAHNLFSLMKENSAFQSETGTWI